ncbi:hypothetical protein PG997_009885 [Apiospora hydei]|uniref:Uncharacterized protein n=1 Tax=Apiospora hydei TaxID=1337664 RepID=A0ABR1VVK1_9PEZI
MGFVLGLVGRAIRGATGSDEHHTSSPCNAQTYQRGYNNQHVSYNQYPQQQPYQQFQPRQGQYAPPPALFGGSGQPGYAGAPFTMPLTKRERRGARREGRHCRRARRHGCRGPAFSAGAPWTSYQAYRPEEEAWTPQGGPFGSREEGHGSNFTYRGAHGDVGPSRSPLFSGDAQGYGGRRRSDETARVGKDEDEELPPPSYEDVVAGTRGKSTERAPLHGRNSSRRGRGWIPM